MAEDEVGLTVRRAYGDWAATYDSDRNLTRDLDEVATRVTLSGTWCERALEVGCGTGKNTTFLATLARRLVALDFAPAMLTRARVRTPAGNVSFVLADLTRPWPCANRSVGLVTCNLVLEHAADLHFVFAEAARVLAGHGRMFVCELHPFRQYEGKRAVYQWDAQPVEVPAFVHHVSDFLAAAADSGLSLVRLREWWHDEDEGRLPRLVSFVFEK